tara:strand:+ start:153 stop:338 length:186 start_codon:yes stop_codon:yes gene_type:complete
MKVIRVVYSIEIPHENLDKIVKKTRLSRRVVTDDIKQMAEVAGRHRVYEFTQSLSQINKGE